MKFRLRASALAVLVGTVVVLAGCSKSPLSPGDGGSLGRLMPPPVATFSEDGTVAYVWAPVAQKAGDPLPSDTATVRGVSRSCDMDGEKGGTLQVGRFSLNVPPGALAGPATVTISMPDSSLMICELSITPQSANGFRVPVELTADLSSPALADAHEFTMYLYDPSWLHWDNLLATSRVDGTKVTTVLEHFSKYAAGKAGW
ncbi:MAG TPA: hypothetical protein VET83_04710 [Candidatus Dormibacteraeota bacterium]|nr:hypothetical protein [Candidatus Dormibacteraeota bacterium]